MLNQHKTNNLGDQLLNKMLCECIRKTGNDCLALGFAQIYEEHVNYHNLDDKKADYFAKVKQLCPYFIKYLMKYKKDLANIQKKNEIKKCDAIIIGGGQLIKHRSIFVYCMINWMKFAKRNKVPIVIWGIGADNNLNKFEQMVYKEVFEYATYINARDNNTAEIIKNNFKIECSISPDIAFTYVPKTITCSNENITVMPYNYEAAVKWLDYKKTRKQYYEDLLKLLISIKIENQSLSDVILTSTTPEDLIECVYFQEYLSNKNINSILMEANTIDDLAEILMGSSCVITGRMHAMIITLLCEKKVIPLEISNKISGFMDEFLTGSINTDVLRNKAFSEFHEFIDCFTKSV